MTCCFGHQLLLDVGADQYLRALLETMEDVGRAAQLIPLQPIQQCHTNNSRFTQQERKVRNSTAVFGDTEATS